MLAKKEYFFFILFRLPPSEKRKEKGKKITNKWIKSKQRDKYCKLLIYIIVTEKKASLFASQGKGRHRELMFYVFMCDGGIFMLSQMWGII